MDKFIGFDVDLQAYASGGTSMPLNETVYSIGVPVVGNR